MDGAKSKGIKENNKDHSETDDEESSISKTCGIISTSDGKLPIVNFFRIIVFCRCRIIN